MTFGLVQPYRGLDRARYRNINRLIFVDSCALIWLRSQAEFARRRWSLRSCSSWRRTVAATASSAVRRWAISLVRPDRVRASVWWVRWSSMIGAEALVAVERGSGEAGFGGDSGEGDLFVGVEQVGPGLFNSAEVCCRSSGLGLRDERVEAGDELAVTVGFSAPAAGGGVGGEGLGVDALGGEDDEVAGVGAEVGAVFADVGVGAGALGGCAQAVAAGQPGLDGGTVAPVGASRFDGQGRADRQVVVRGGFWPGRARVRIRCARCGRTAGRSAGSSARRRARAGPSAPAATHRR